MLLTPDTGLIGGGGLKTQGQNAAKQLLAKHLCKETFLISMQPLVSKMVILFIILALLHLQCLCSFLFDQCLSTTQCVVSALTTKPHNSILNQMGKSELTADYNNKFWKKSNKTLYIFSKQKTCETDIWQLLWWNCFACGQFCWYCFHNFAVVNTGNADPRQTIMSIHLHLSCIWLYFVITHFTNN